MKNTKIEWADHTVNFWWGCQKVSPACEHCYAESLDRIYGGRFDEGRRHWGPESPRWIRFDRALAEIVAMETTTPDGRRPRVFINSMSDSFEDHPALTVVRCQMLVVLGGMYGCDFLLLTKRPENVRKMVPPGWLVNWPAHVWIGTTVEDQHRSNLRLPLLGRIPAKVRFLSCEPLLGPINLGLMAGIHWVIAGGESGPGARPMRLEWARGLRDQCQAAAVPFHFKQWGEHAPTPEVEGAMYRPGKKAAGRLLDGREWNERFYENRTYRVP